VRVPDGPSGSGERERGALAGDGGALTNGEPNIRLLICDDHRILTEALTMIFEMDQTIEMVTDPVADPLSAIEACRELHPDVVLMDIDLKASIDGIEATRQIKDVSPATRVVILTSFEDDRLVVSAVEAGASGFLRKTDAVQEVVETVKAAARDEVLIDSALLTRMLAQVARERRADRGEAQAVERLTGREVEILELLARGLRSEEIAGALHISLRTVQTHIHNLLTKLGVRSRLEAVALASRAGLVSPGRSSG